MATGLWVLSIITYLFLGWETQLWCLFFPCQPIDEFQEKYLSTKTQNSITMQKLITEWRQ